MQVRTGYRVSRRRVLPIPRPSHCDGIQAVRKVVFVRAIAARSVAVDVGAERKRVAGRFVLAEKFRLLRSLGVSVNSTNVAESAICKSIVVVSESAFAVVVFLRVIRAFLLTSTSRLLLGFEEILAYLPHMALIEASARIQASVFHQPEKKPIVRPYLLPGVIDAQRYGPADDGTEFVGMSATEMRRAAAAFLRYRPRWCTRTAKWKRLLRMLPIASWVFRFAVRHIPSDGRGRSSGGCYALAQLFLCLGFPLEYNSQVDLSNFPPASRQAFTVSAKVLLGDVGLALLAVVVPSSGFGGTAAAAAAAVVRMGTGSWGGAAVAGDGGGVARTGAGGCWKRTGAVETAAAEAFANSACFASCFAFALDLPGLLGRQCARHSRDDEGTNKCGR
ncbi:hypothetical protein BU16DRAFT_595974 [Lophium mytilinum]|uniref:Uncharacterized protein n=1 Tax=Lophium mytilinum TaxID=390894 RepID=A0A6A6QGM0_9PEZI|nr:hypothetical protein BU16DRAFT_595974 [Lophium mytilinum]